jgi:hypothetical protein
VRASQHQLRETADKLKAVRIINVSEQLWREQRVAAKLEAERVQLEDDDVRAIIDKENKLRAELDQQLDQQCEGDLARRRRSNQLFNLQRQIALRLAAHRRRVTTMPFHTRVVRRQALRQAQGRAHAAPGDQRARGRRQEGGCGDGGGGLGGGGEGGATESKTDGATESETKGQPRSHAARQSRSSVRYTAAPAP